ncbi:MAG TPA: PIN domain-containing protein [Planctomycetota bacterium]|nr:PIN domain-containing protein [Planctomycetota bacterium]
MSWVIADADVWIKGFNRSHPDPLAVHRLGALVRERRLLVPGLIRQGVLARTRDARQFARVAELLAAFPEVPPRMADDLEAARLRQRVRGLDPARALLWAQAITCGARLWSDDPSWTEFAAHGCPLIAR